MSAYQRRRELGELFSEAVRRECAHLGWGAVELGRALIGDEHAPREQAWHRGHVWLGNRKQTCPRLDTVEAVAKALGCSPFKLMPWAMMGAAP